MKFNPKLAIISLGLFLSCLSFAFLLHTHLIFAGNNTVATSVIVGNSSPAFTVQPAENPISSTSSPTNVGTSIAFSATATDSNSENYYLAICKGNNVTPVNGSAPTCPDGNWCISTSTASGAAASCNYTTLQGDVETNNWYAFVCDGNASSAACSASSQGSGDSGSPFIVNHPPSFASVGVTTPVNVGATVSWTGVGASDPDTAGGADTVKLVVCKTSGVTNDDCDGGASDKWCESTPAASSPTCSIGITVPTVDQTYNAYVYVFDSHAFASSGAGQNSAANFVVNNATPTISSITINGGSDISVTEGVGATKVVALSASVTDNNGCSDLSTVTASVYRSGITYANCDEAGNANGNQCYPLISCSTSNCTGGSASATYTCNAYLKSYADPTTADSKFPSDNWRDTFVATDNNSAVGSSEVSTGVEVNTLVALDVTNSINYGNLSAGQKNDPLAATTNITATGNTGIDQDLKGTNMLKVGQTDVFIAVNNQKYALSSGTAYDVGTTLTLTDVTALINVPKTTSDVGNTKLTYWGLLVPNGTSAGTYSGTNTVTAKIGATDTW